MGKWHTPPATPCSPHVVGLHTKAYCIGAEIARLRDHENGTVYEMLDQGRSLIGRKDKR